MGILVKEITYLSLKVGLDGSNLVTDVYSKDTDTHQYLDNRSSHPTHVKKSIPYGQAFRFGRKCESGQIFSDRLGELRDDLLKRWFKKRIIEE